MTLENAQNWRGEGYHAICLAGASQQGGIVDVVSNDGELYKTIGLADPVLMNVEHTRDAENKEVEDARAFLERAVLALHDMMEGLSDQEVDLVKTLADGLVDESLEEARKNAKTRKCKVPRPLLEPNASSGRKPACLVTFGDPGDSTMHPAPDPLLLVLRAANTFGIMAGMKMLAPDIYLDDFSIGDIIEEEAFLEAREQSFRPKTWTELANGLGQPNGYFASIREPH